MFKPIDHKKSGRHLDWVWAGLMTMTLLSAVIAERAEPHIMITIVIAFMIILKAQLVIDYFMELTEAKPLIYYLMCAYFYVFPIMAIFVWLFPETLASWTRLD